MAVISESGKDVYPCAAVYHRGKTVHVFPFLVEAVSEAEAKGLALNIMNKVGRETYEEWARHLEVGVSVLIEEEGVSIK